MPRNKDLKRLVRTRMAETGERYTQALPNSWFATLVRWLPGGEALSPIARASAPVSPHLFSAWGEFAVFSGYAVVLLALGAWLFVRRDA